MTRRPKLILGFAFLIVEVLARGQSIETSALSSKLDSYLQLYVKVNDFSGVVLVAQGDRVLALREYGLADRMHALNNRRSTAFRLASLSKTFTAAAIVMLIERGTVHLEDSLSHFFPEFPKRRSHHRGAASLA
jgi:CubicO group peptidase (beta-lactamase class C family)